MEKDTKKNSWKNRGRISLIINNTIRCSHNHWNNDTVYISIGVWRTNIVIGYSLLHRPRNECDRAFCAQTQEKLFNSYRAKRNAKQSKHTSEASQMTANGECVRVCVRTIWSVCNDNTNTVFFTVCCYYAFCSSLFYLIRVLALYFVGISVISVYIRFIHDMTMTTAWDWGKVTANTSAYEYT